MWAVGEFTTTLDNRQPNGDRSYHVPLTASCDPANCGSPAMLATNNVANYADWVTNITSTTITATFGVADTIIHGLRVRGSSLSGYDTLSFAYALPLPLWHAHLVCAAPSATVPMRPSSTGTRCVWRACPMWLRQLCSTRVTTATMLNTNLIPLKRARR